MSRGGEIDRDLRQTTLISAIISEIQAIILMPLIVGGLVDSHTEEQQCAADGEASWSGAWAFTVILWVRSIATVISLAGNDTQR